MFINTLNKLSIWAHKSPAQFLKITAATSFTIGSLAFIGGLIINDKIPKKEKNFMIAQEGAEGVLNLGVFLGAASAFEEIGRILVKKGILRPDVVLDGKKLPLKEVQEAVKTYFKNPTALPDKIFGPVSKAVKFTEVAASLVGTVLAFNIIVPLIRNKVASRIDKKHGKKLVDNNLTPYLPAGKLNTRMEYNPKDPFATFEKRMNIQPVRTPVSFSGSSGMRI